MKPIYIVYEVDPYRSYDSMVIKLITNNKKIAKEQFNKGKKYYNKNEAYSLNVSEYIPKITPECDNNILRDMDSPFLTTEK